MPTLMLPAQLEQLERVNAFIQDHIPPKFQELRSQVELAAEELLVNVFSYAYPEGSSGRAEVGCREVMLDGEPFYCFTVRDWGKPFDPFSEAPEPDLSLGVEERPIGGLGVFLIKSIVAHYSHSYTDGCNHIELFFSLPKADA